MPGHMVRWRSPLPGYYKLNVGDVIDLQDGARGVAVVVCDSCGVLSGAVVMRALGLVSVLATELYTRRPVCPLPLMRRSRHCFLSRIASKQSS